MSAEAMWHAAFVRSPVAHGRVRSVDASNLPANCVALLPKDTAGLGRHGCQLRDQSVLADPARFVGDVVAAVAAPTRAAARAAAQLVTVQIDELPAVFDPLAAVAAGAPLLHPESGDPAVHGVHPLAGTNVCHRFKLAAGDVESGFAQADVVVEGTFRTASARRASMEPSATLAAWTPDGGLELRSATQLPSKLREDLAGLFGIAPERTRVITSTEGASLEATTYTRLEPLVACLARKAQRPVRAVLELDEELVTLNSHPAVVRVRIGAREDGIVMAKQVDCWAGAGAYAGCGPGVATHMGHAGVGPYRIPHVRVDAMAVYTNLPPGGGFRGQGATQSVWASERAMDLLAERLGVSALELRRRNLLRDGDRFATGALMRDVHFEQCLQAAADAVDYESDPRGKGLCVAIGGEHGRHQSAAAAQVSVDHGTGRVTVERLHAAVYAGRAVDRARAERENESAMVTGLGTALFESVEHDEYCTPALGDLPRQMTHELIEREGAELRGPGETALPPVPAAIGNAVGSLGIALTDLPMTSEDVLG